MPRTYLLERSQYLPGSVEEVFSFFSDARNLQKITPEFLHFHVETPGPIEIREGTLIDYRLRLYGAPLRWRSKIVEFHPPSRFVDVQLHGPYRQWRHAHEFASEGDGTRMTDRVEYQLPLGPLGAVAQALFVGRTLEAIFDYRRRRIAELLGEER